MDSLIVMTDNLLKNVLSRIREVKEELQDQIDDVKRGLLEKIERVKIEILNDVVMQDPRSCQIDSNPKRHSSQRSLSIAFNGKQDSVSTKDNNNDVEELWKAINSLKSFQKKISFDYHFLNERFSQFQRMTDNKIDSLGSESRTSESNQNSMIANLQSEMKEMAKSINTIEAMIKGQGEEHERFSKVIIKMIRS